MDKLDAEIIELAPRMYEALLILAKARKDGGSREFARRSYGSSVQDVIEDVLRIDREQQ